MISSTQVEQARNSPYHRWNKLPHVTFSHFSTLGVARWVDDEVINHFITKWCKTGTTLGLSTFFACKHLFQQVTCINAKSGALTLEDQSQVLRWCRKAVQNLCLHPSWDAVFIPIHEGSCHWYSAWIDFSRKRIEIYDSLREVCTTNRPKPLLLRKNTSLMLVLMWLTEVLSHMRGVPVRLSNNPGTDWTFDSHSEIRNKREHHCEDRFSFSDNMAGKRLRLAQDILRDCESSLLPMDISCPVCNKTFSRPQDQLAHLNLTRDKDHRRHVHHQNQILDRRFVRALETAIQAKRNGSRRRARKLRSTNGRVIGVSNVNARKIGRNQEFFAASASASSFPTLPMDVDIGVAVQKDTEQLDDALFEQTLDEIFRRLGSSGDDESGDFVFLPDPAAGAVDNTLDSGPPLYRSNHSLVEDGTPSICIWHPTAGKVFGSQPNVHERWRELFSKQGPEGDKRYKPFVSRLEWEMARWTVMEKVSQKSFDRLLQIPNMKENLGLNIGGVRSMLKKVDEIPDRCGPWYTKKLTFKDRPNEHFVVHHRNPLSAIKALWGDPALATSLVYKPSKLFQADSDQTEGNRIYNEMWTAGFWNAAQNEHLMEVLQQLIPEGGTVAPVILASDKTQLTQFTGNKNAYPVYLTIGNIPKSLRRKPGSRACTLIAYLFADKLDKVGLNDTSLKLRNYELFHRSMSVILEPLKTAGHPSGPGIQMVGSDGAVRRVYPLLAAYIADYPEQCLVTCTKYGTCPKCQCPAQKLDITTVSAPRTQEWTGGVIQQARTLFQGRGRAIHACAMESEVAGGDYEPFWVGFPLMDIHQCITPDILHQLYQGVFKHLVGWVQKIVGEKELDERIRALPLTDGVRHFAKGISGLAQLSGTEHRHIARFLLACLIGKIDDRGVVACRGILHFIHLAQYPSHDGNTLRYMQEALNTWHQSREFFVTAGARTHFKIPKLHSLLHYADSIRWLGTTDNYNTEAFERLHIDAAKEGWRSSNKRDYFPQMVQFLSRKEKISSFDFYQSSENLNSHICNDFKTAGGENPMDPNNSDDSDDPDDKDIVIGITKSRPDQVVESTMIRLAKQPHEPRKKLSHILVSHCAPGFITQLKLFLRSLLPGNQVGNKNNALQSPLPFSVVEVWHHFKLTPLKILDEPERAILRATPFSRNNSNPRYDTVLVLDSDEAESTAVAGCRAARVRVIFRLPQVVKRHGFPISAPRFWPSEPLAYVTWFTRFEGAPNKVTGMYRVEPARASNGEAQGAIIPLSDVRQHCMLAPSRREWERGWTSHNILDEFIGAGPSEIQDGLFQLKDFDERVTAFAGAVCRQSKGVDNSISLMFSAL
ncbi:hypothetical protein D9757_015253 [Collybiopsis confluens]|uniref:Ubiquitin-like protease family profile domain-containing protein n=1 Tax=Collybiopsis confluens TaxID=2823264 RepID=A0A8H5FPC4_9AGAR|nr:hypothetical protein D9757_015253 [Collybiopsis confluens]